MCKYGNSCNNRKDTKKNYPRLRLSVLSIRLHSIENNAIEVGSVCVCVGIILNDVVYE